MNPQVTIIPAGFENPLVLGALLLVPVIIAAYIFALTRRNKRGMRFTNTSLLEVAMKRQSAWRRHVAVGLSLLSLVTLSIAAAKPFGIVDVPRERATIVIVLDVSQSMLAVDVPPTRLDAAKTAAKQFIDQVPAAYNIALVTMSGSPAIKSPPTTEHALLKRVIDTFKPEDSTAVGSAIELALRALQQAPKDPKDPDAVAPGSIVLLSDGESTAGTAPQQAAAKAEQDKVPIYTIAFGTPDGFVDLDNERFAVPVSSDDLRQIAEISKGKFFQAGNLGQLNEAYENVRSQVGYVPMNAEVTHIYVIYGLLFAVLAALAAISLAAKWP